MHDVLIVGGGPAGLSAALTLGRMRRRTLVVDAGQPRNGASPALHNMLSRDGTAPNELRGIALGELAAYPTVEVREGSVVDIEPAGDGFTARLAGGEAVRAARVVLATGLADELPPIEGLVAHWGRGVLHCPYCHGHEVADAPLAVLGATPERVLLALHLTRLSTDVVLCPLEGEEPSTEDTRRLHAAGVAVRDAPLVSVGVADGESLGLVFADGSELERRALFVASAPRQRSDLAQRLGCATFEDGTIEVDDDGATSVPGVYAVGDMAKRASMRGPAAAVVCAAASGVSAATAVDRDLLRREYGWPWGEARGAARSSREVVRPSARG